MIIFPAIDLYQGQAVRLLRGDYAQMTVYSRDPLAVARQFVEAGATHIHMVDLEGARDGGTPNLELAARVAAETPLFVEIGGGIRSMETIDRCMQAGIQRVILGTAAVQDPRLLAEAADKYGDRISVGADVKDGKIAIKGWKEVAPLTLEQLLRQMQTLGLNHVICTDISRDGAMTGTNLQLYGQLSREFSMRITASGGVSTLEDVVALRQMELYGAIIGKAWYTGAIDLKTAIEVAK